jgi:hypothetical protein
VQGLLVHWLHWVYFLRPTLAGVWGVCLSPLDHGSRGTNDSAHSCCRWLCWLRCCSFILRGFWVGQTPPLSPPMGKVGGFYQFWGFFQHPVCVGVLFQRWEGFCYFNSCAGGRQWFSGWCHTNQLPMCVYKGAGGPDCWVTCIHYSVGQCEHASSAQLVPVTMAMHPPQLPSTEVASCCSWLGRKKCTNKQVHTRPSSLVVCLRGT